MEILKPNYKKIALEASQGKSLSGLFKGVPVAEVQKFFANSGPELLMRYFTSEIQPLLFRGNNFLSRARNDDAFVNYDSVQLAHSGTIPSATVNNTILPATISPRIDAPTQYNLEEIEVQPVLIGRSEELTVAYNKRQSVLEQQALVIMQKCGDRALWRWASGANASHIVSSSGAYRPSGNTNGAQTGNRKSFTIADLTSVQALFFQDNVANELEDIMGVAIVTPRQYQDLLNIAQFTQWLQYGEKVVPDGVMKRAFGFDFYVRSLVVNLDNSQNVKAEGAAGATSDQDAAIFYSPNYVRRAVGQYIPFINENRAEYYGSLFSAIIRFGAVQARNDSKGVVLLYESN